MSLNQQLLDNNYLIIKDFISQEKAQYLNDWVENEKNKGTLSNDERYSIGLYAKVCMDGIPFLDLLCEKINDVSDLVGEKILPTYTYCILYEENAVLRRHKDRNACEISVTLHLGGDAKWDLGIKTPDNKEVNLNLNIGDAILYLGCNAEHWRNGPFKGKNYTQVMLHYVRSNGQNAWAYFDKIKSL